ncbi:MAG TPA: murein L,D-transpeptidase catalytic domain family protein [Croceibacterium sp.]|nr:murein L,D-transpeptidase catalytic domain family protein [Croceibacterium sp.]
MSEKPFQIGRRALMVSGAAVAASSLVRSASGPLKTEPPAITPVSFRVNTARKLPASLDPQLVERALAALDEHSDAVTRRDRIAIVDFTAPSSEKRLHFLDIGSGEVSHLRVTHGTGSDPGHTGFLHSFSNAFNSNASSEGAFVTADYYVGKHGRSQRLQGLDPTNNNALDRAIVIHGAWYANADMIKSHGKLGRSQGCFAVGEDDLNTVFDHLGKGRLIYAARA